MTSALNISRSILASRWVQLALVLILAVTLRFVNLSSAPLGYFHDEAWSGAKALALLDGSVSPQVYFAENNGMDALPVYLIALLFQFTGPAAIGSRIISALMGSLTVLATYWAAWELFLGDKRQHTIALIAAFVNAMLFAAIATSRSGWHSISIALFAMLCLAALTRGRRLDRQRWFILAGALAGMAQYTYPSARFLPVWLVVIALLDLWLGRGQRRAMVGHYLLLSAAAMLFFLPLGLFFWQNPEWFFARASQTTEALNLGQNTLRTLLGFSVSGSRENLHNLPGRPLLDPILSLFFVVGLGVSMIRHRAVHVILLAGLVIFTLPVLLTEAAPLTRRWTAVLPIVSIIVAVGVVAVVQFLTDRVETPRARRVIIAAVMLALLGSAVWSAADYFGPYLQNPQLFWEYDSGITQVADRLRHRPDTKFFLTPYDRFYEVVALTLAEERRESVQSYNGMECALFPARTDRVTEWLVIDEKDQRTLPLLQKLYPGGQIVWGLDSPVGTYARAWQVPAGETAHWEMPLKQQANFDDRVQLVGADVPLEAQAGTTVPVRLALQDRQVLDQLYKIFVHVRGANNTIVAQADRALCGLTLNEADWRPGDVLLEETALAIPAGTPPGEYPIVIGLYREATGARLPVREAELDHDGDSVTIGLLRVR
jgi:4-amino-4-deoxy-L-arabinose transferase-like glycosyltransferase